jgi:hypothetical protein
MAWHAGLMYFLMAGLLSLPLNTSFWLQEYLYLCYPCLVCVDEELQRFLSGKLGVLAEYVNLKTREKT